MGTDDVTPAVSERWSRAFDALSADARRQLLIALLDCEPGAWLTVPDDVSGFDPEAAQVVRVEFRHRHLPALADAGYAEWIDGPLRARRGPRFEEVGAVLDVLLDAGDRLPPHLVWGCASLEERI
jgi:hypothetical protein